tara:strand:+ start:8057 stop:8968 length:912 start_codon:yes stop_codon:yes gene_type:complete
MLTDRSLKIPKEYKCEKCNYITCNKKDFNKHLLTEKHIILTNVDNNSQKIPDKTFSCECGKKYKHRQSLSVHKKKCILIIENTDLITIEDKKEILELKEDNKELKEDNKELKNMIKELIKENAKQQEQISELIPKIGNNNNNIQNNKFNINMFLNEQCKDAINMSDFIKSLHITFEQLDFTNKKGLADGLSKSIIENMNKLSIYQRPMHCTDVKRETLYIKDEDSWSKDKSKEKIKGAINKASSKNFNALMDWKMSNPDYMNSEDKTDYFTKTISTIGKPSSSIDEKVIKNLCKETYVKNSEN